MLSDSSLVLWKYEPDFWIDYVTREPSICLMDWCMKMEEEKQNRQKIPIREWFDIERKMAIIARMTADRPLFTSNQDEPEEVLEQLEVEL